MVRKVRAVAEAVDRRRAEGLARAESGRYGLIVLDLKLPGIDGLEICRRLRQRPDYVPILMLTAKTSEIDRVLGLELGADDYITKPFSLRELVARVKAIFRRVAALESRGDDASQLRIGQLEVDLLKHRGKVAGRPLRLTGKEFDLLAQLARNPGRAYSRGELLDLVWGYHHDGYEHTVSSYVNRLRRKVEEDPAHPCYIQTVWGVGYRMVDPKEERVV